MAVTKTRAIVMVVNQQWSMTHAALMGQRVYSLFVRHKSCISSGPQGTP